jgi:hypothetical protein
MYPRLTISNLTEGLRNVYTNKKSEGSLRQSTLMQSNGESMWTSKVKITADATPTAGVFTVSLEEKYYNKKWDFR